MKIKYDVQILSTMALFEKITHARLKDCFDNRDKLTFVVQEGQIGKALGKQRVNLKKLEDTFKRKIKIVEFNSDILTFIKNLMFPLRILEIKREEDIIIIKGPDTKTKGLMIGAQAQNLRNYEEVTKKYFPELKEIKIV